MSDFASMRSIQLRNQILTPQVLQLYRSGNLDFSNIQGTSSPLNEIYQDTYRYIDYPNLTPEAYVLLEQALANPPNMSPAPLAPPISAPSSLSPSPITAPSPFVYTPSSSKIVSPTYPATSPMMSFPKENFRPVRSHRENFSPISAPASSGREYFSHLNTATPSILLPPHSGPVAEGIVYGAKNSVTPAIPSVDGTYVGDYQTYGPMYASAVTANTNVNQYNQTPRIVYTGK